MEHGIESRSVKKTKALYADHEEDFPKQKSYEKVVVGFFEMVSNNLSKLKGTYMMKPYVIYSLFCVYAHAKLGIPNGKKMLGYKPKSKFKIDSKAIAGLRGVIDAHEANDETGRYADYVKASTKATTMSPARVTRARVLAKLLLN